MKTKTLFLILIFSCLKSFSQTLAPDQIEKLKVVIWNSIHHTHAKYSTTEFSGSYDWHSDVHAHWTLLSMARVTQDQDLEDKMMSILTIERLEREYQFLMAPENANFEKPYGRTWMLLLLWELSHREISNNQRFQKIRWDLTQDMLQWLKSADFPEQSYGHGLIGTHDSWLMSLFLFKLSKSKNLEVSKQIKQLIKEKMEPLAAQIESKAMEPNDFLYLPALKYLIDHKGRYDKNILPIPTTAGYACHYPGAIQVSLWAEAAQCARQDAAACTVVQNASQSFFAQTMLWKKDFDCVAHWVPQFTWMTHWLSLGRE